MQVKITDNKEQWDNWLKNNMERNAFPQSWAWGEILLAEGKKVERLAVIESEEILAQAQVVYSRLPFGWRYAFCPQGPVIKISNDKFLISNIYKILADYFKDKNCVFFRIEPEFRTENPELKIKKTIDINPPATLILDLNKSEEELLAAMRQKTRYNIHLAEKKGLRIVTTPPSIPPLKGEGRGVGFEVFWSLMNQTGQRDKFKLHAKTHYEQVLNSPIVFQLTANFGDKPIAGAVFVKFGDTFTYLYGTSDYARRDLMAPYLLQWEGIKMAKKLGYRWYDFFGIAPLIDGGKYNPRHQYAGVTRFKFGFGGEPRQAPGTFDLVIDAGKYKMYNFLRKLRRLV